jgi:flagellar hook assembly protein FlgD
MVLAFELPEPVLVHAEVYDAGGRLVRILADDLVPAGRHQRAWDRRDEQGTRVPAGIYFIRLDAGANQSRQKVVVVT